MSLDVIVEEDDRKDRVLELQFFEELLFHYLSILALIPYKWDNLKTIIDNIYEPYTIDQDQTKTTNGENSSLITGANLLRDN